MSYTYNQLLNTKGIDWILTNLSKEDLIKVVKDPTTTFSIEKTCCICYEDTTDPTCCKRCKEGIVCSSCFSKLDNYRGKKCPICRKKF